MGEAGTTIAGAGGRFQFRGSEEAASRYGGNPADWIKQTSTTYIGRDGITFETHWVENIKTGQRAEFKAKFQGED